MSGEYVFDGVRLIRTKGHGKPYIGPPPDEEVDETTEPKEKGQIGLFG